MAAKRDYYEDLGVKKDATDDELRADYRKLAVRYHPDRCKDKDATAKFQEISEAYEVLHDKEKRAKYDQFGFDGPSAAGFNPSGFNPFDMFRAHFGSGFMDDDFGGFGSMFGHRQQPSREPDFDSPEDGHDIQLDMQLPFKDVLYGCTKEVDIDLDEPCSSCGGRGIEKGSTLTKCSHCGGSGQIVHTQHNGFMMSQTISVCPYCHGQGASAKPCKKCNGHKRVSAKKHLSIKIPAGIDNGQRLRVAGKGECGIKGGHDGDMYIRVAVEPSKLYERSGLNLKTIVPIDAVTATLGGKVEVQTPWEKTVVNVPAKTRSGDSKTLNGQGIRLQNGQKGYLLVEFKVMPFNSLTSQQTKLLEELKKTLSQKNTLGLDEYKLMASEFARK